MSTVYDSAEEFARRVKIDRAVKARFSTVENLQAFLKALMEFGISLSNDCIDRIEDKALRDIVRACVASTVAGASVGAALGGMAAGPAGMATGAVIGAACGLVVGLTATGLHFLKENGNGFTVAFIPSSGT